jgi:hypothetical protein
LRGIVRISDSPNHKPGWQVKVRRQYEKHHRYFTDAQYGGVRASLRAAMAHRDKISKKMPPMTRRQSATVLKKTNTSGIVGVHRRIKPVTRRGKRWKYAVWTATGSPRPYERKVKDFYVSVWGEREAKRLAIEQRKEWEDEMDDNS